MMKNSEWGAVAYFAQSSYGKNEEVWINPNSNYLTGHAGGKSSADYTTYTKDYTSINGQASSTTGNVYGIYDMSGCGIEYIASYVDNGHLCITNTTFGGIIGESTTFAYLKQVYGSKGSEGKSDKVTDYAKNAGIYGDAVYESSGKTSPIGSSIYDSWYDDSSNFPYSDSPFFGRGGLYNDTSRSGLFAFGYDYGRSHMCFGFRQVSPSL